ncbi:MAG: extracellular solute-binding protein [Candidatus Enteromonas sp.]|nr:extracellular solute-binding protein [Candidatus Enteromonas sp.]
MNPKKCLLLASLSALSLSSCALLPTLESLGQQSSQAESSISHQSSSKEGSSEKDNPSSSPFSPTDKTPDLTYWCPERDAEVTESIVDEFKASKKEYKNLRIVPLGYYWENDVYYELQQDPAAAADVMAILDEHILSAVADKVIAPFSEEERAAFIASDGAEAVKACSANGTLYGLPYRADNSPMPIYDSTVYDTPDKLASWEAVLETAQKAGKKVYFEFKSGWFNATLLTVGGTTFTRQKNAEGQYEMYTDITDPDKIDGAAAALNSFKTLFNTYRDTWAASSDFDRILSGFESGEVAYAFLWDCLGELRQVNPNVKVGLWPTINVNEADAQMKCFVEHKAFVCKQNTNLERLALAKEFAKFLANRNSQVKRAKVLGYGPSNWEAQATEEAKGSEFTARIAEMAQMGATFNLTANTTLDFWPPMEILGREVVNGEEGWGEYGTAQRLIQILFDCHGWTNVKTE